MNNSNNKDTANSNSQDDKIITFIWLSFNWRFYGVASNVSEYLCDHQDKSLELKQIHCFKRSSVKEVESNMTFKCNKLQTKMWAKFIQVFFHYLNQKLEKLEEQSTWERRSTKVRKVNGKREMHMIAMEKKQVSSTFSLWGKVQLEYEFSYYIVERDKATMWMLEPYEYQNNEVADELQSLRLQDDEEYVAKFQE